MMMKQAGTHSGKFHGDCAFALATMYMAGVISSHVRSRDAEVLSKCDFRVDVGGKFNPAAGDFDHHQKGGAGIRENWVPYASFGLIWRAFGMGLCQESEEVFRLVDEKLVQPVDARDCGYKSELYVASGYSISEAVLSMNPTWLEGYDFDGRFTRALQFATGVLEREIAQAKAVVQAKPTVLKSLHESSDPRILVLDCCCPWKDTVIEEGPEVLFTVYPYELGDRWMAEAVPQAKGTQAIKRPFPADWAGKTPEQLAGLTGVTDAIFCHNARFIAGAWSQEGALKLAQLALI